MTIDMMGIIRKSIISWKNARIELVKYIYS